MHQQDHQSALQQIDLSDMFANSLCLKKLHAMAVAAHSHPDPRGKAALNPTTALLTISHLWHHAVSTRHVSISRLQR